MRVAGDAEGCEGLARSLFRAAAEVHYSASVQSRARASLTTWTGTAASRWVDSGLAVFASGERTAERIAQVGYALHEHGVVLAELQTRAARLDADARSFGMALQDDGWMDPVHVPAQPTEQDLVHPSVMLRSQVRDRLVTAALALRLEEQQLHDRLARALRDLDAERVPMPGRQLSLHRDGSAGLGLAPSVVGSAAELAARHGGRAAQQSGAWAAVVRAAEGAGKVLRNAPGINVVSFGSGVATDVGSGTPTHEAVGRNAASTAAGMAAGAVAAVAVAGPTVATAVTVGMPLAVGAAAGYAGTKVWDAASARTLRQEPVRPDPRPLPRRTAPSPTVSGRPPAVETATTATLEPASCEDQDLATQKAREGLRERVRH